MKLPAFSRSTRLIGLLILVLAATGYGAWRWMRSSQAQSHFEQAQAHASQDKLFDAYLEILKSLELKESREARLLAARLSRQLGKDKEAKKHLDLARPETGTNEAYQLEQLMYRAHIGDPPAVQSILLRYIAEKRPEASLCREALVRGYITRQRLGPVLTILDAWERDTPNDLQYKFCRGLFNMELDLPKHAVPLLEEVVKVDPGRSIARVNLAAAYESMSNFEAAVPHYEYLLETEGPKEVILQGLAACYVGVQKYDKAEEISQKLLSISPGDTIALRVMGQVEMGRGNLPEAENYFREASEGPAGDYLALYELIQCLNRQQKDSTAVKDRLDARYKKGGKLHELTRLKITAPVSQRADVYYQIAKLVHETGNPHGALHNLNIALKYNPRHQPSHRFLVDYYTKQGNRSKVLYHRRFLQKKN